MDCTLHLIDEKQYREIYIPAVAGDESALNQLLEWASLLSAGWESRSEAYRLVKDLRSKLSLGDVDRVLEGDLDPLIHAYLVWRKTGKTAGDDKDESLD